MDGAKLITDTEEHTAVCLIGRRTVRAKVSLRRVMNRSVMRILVVVGTKCGENPHR